MPLLPLFPLGTVLAPGADLPLQLFEPRYLRLLHDVLSDDDAEPEFGAVAIRRGHEVGVERTPDLHAVGTVARIVRAAGLDDGRWMVLGQGSRRFRLERIAEEVGTPYLTGEVTWLDEPDGEGPLEDQAARLRAEVAAYLLTTGVRVRLPGDPCTLSHEVGAVMGLPLGDQQALLAAADTSTRLRLALRLVHRERNVVVAFGAVPGRPAPPANLN